MPIPVGGYKPAYGRLNLEAPISEAKAPKRAVAGGRTAPSKGPAIAVKAVSKKSAKAPAVAPKLAAMMAELAPPKGKK